MKYDHINEIARYLLMRKTNDENDKTALYTHGLRVGRLSGNLAGALGIVFRPETLYIASLFHDCATGLPKYIETAWLAREALTGAIDAELLGEICELIELKEAPQTEELPELVCVMRDADILDGLGTKAIWSHFSRCFAHGAALDDSIASFDQSDYKRRMARDRKSLYFELSKDIFDQRAVYCEEFAQRMALENEGNLV